MQVQFSSSGWGAGFASPEWSERAVDSRDRGDWFNDELPQIRSGQTTQIEISFGYFYGQHLEFDVDDLTTYIGLEDIEEWRGWVSEPEYGMIDSIQLEIETVPIPIPGAVWMLGSGLVGLVALRRKKKA